MRHDYRISIIASFILILLTVGTGLSVFMVMRHQTKQIIEKSLQLSLTNHIRRLKSAINREIGISQAIATDPFLIKMLKYLDRYPTDPAAIRALYQSVDTFLPLHFSLIEISTLNHHVVISSGIPIPHPALDVPLHLAIDTHLLWANGGLVLMQKQALFDRHHQRVGWLMTTEALLPSVTRMLKEFGSLGKTEELFLCSKLPHPAIQAMQCFPTLLGGGHVLPHVPFRLKGRLLPMVYALRGEVGLITTRDYRGRQVIAAYAPIGNLGIGAALKIDTKEFYGPIDKQISKVIYTLLFFLVIGLLLLFWLVNPLIRKLTFSERSVRQSNIRLQDSEAHLRTILENLDEGLFTVSEAGVIQSTNLAAEQLLGYSPGSLVGQDILNVISPDSHPKYRDRMQHYAAQDPSDISARFGLCALRRDGREFPAEVHVSNMLLRGQYKFIITLQDITGRKEAEARILHLATYDSLTGLPNRSLLEDRIKQAIQISQRDRKGFAVIYIDLNDFKSINDSLGHNIGDALLKVVAKRLRNCLRGKDTVARQGGDEFIIVLSDITHAGDALITVQKILDALDKTYFIEEHELHSGANLGIALYPEDGQDTTMLLKNSDTAMYAAKAAGRHNYRFYSLKMDAIAAERLMMGNNLHHAIEHDELTLHYQPIVSVASSEILAVESLLRWTSQSMGSISPARFIPVAEDSGLILPIGEWVLETACRQIRAWEACGIAIGRTVINLSPLQFRQADLVGRFTRIIEDTGIDPSRLGMEITESCIMEDPDTSICMLNEFKAMGIELSLDDFGTGYSSLSYLKRFPVDKLKIDQSFIRDLTHDRSDEALVEAIIAMAGSLKIRVIAEGVETEQQLDFLRQHHCDQYQGYYYSRPLPAHELQLKILEAR